jgi:hypothetical protein
MPWKPRPHRTDTPIGLRRESSRRLTTMSQRGNKLHPISRCTAPLRSIEASEIVPMGRVHWPIGANNPSGARGKWTANGPLDRRSRCKQSHQKKTFRLPTDETPNDVLSQRVRSAATIAGMFDQDARLIEADFSSSVEIARADGSHSVRPRQDAAAIFSLAARRDEALVAWLASRAIEADSREDGEIEDVFDGVSAEDSMETGCGPADAVFALLRATTSSALFTCRR